MARAMRASTFLKPNAMRVMSRILVLTDSMRALDSRWAMALRIGSRAFLMLRCQFGERGPLAAPCPAQPEVEGFDGLVVGQLEDGAQAFLE